MNDPTVTWTKFWSIFIKVATDKLDVTLSRDPMWAGWFRGPRCSWAEFLVLRQRIDEFRYGHQAIRPSDWPAPAHQDLEFSVAVPGAFVLVGEGWWIEFAEDRSELCLTLRAPVADTQQFLNATAEDAWKVRNSRYHLIQPPYYDPTAPTLTSRVWKMRTEAK